jgi:hypothetical protein
MAAAQAVRYTPKEMKTIPDQYIYPKFRRHILTWMKIFTPICLANSFSLYFFHGPEYPSYETFSMLLPFVNLGGIWLILMGYFIYWLSNYDEYFETKYLKGNYPKIWKKLHPWGDFSVNGFAGILFVCGRYDDGTDTHLYHIKQNRKETLKMMSWVFFLVPVAWFLSVGSMLLARIQN